MGGCVWLGIMLMVLRPGFITLAAGGGIIVLGLMFFFFLVKFIVAKTKNENPLRMELQENDYPELFAFIRQLTKETDTLFPKKIRFSGCEAPQGTDGSAIAEL